MAPDARREQLLDAALDIILRDGYGKVSIEAIAREVDVTRPVVYNAFENLDTLLLELLDRQERRALEVLFTTVAARTSAAAGLQLDALVSELAAMVATDPRTWAPIFCTTVETPAVVSQRIAQDRELVRAFFAGQLERQQRHQATEARLDAAVASHVLVAIGEYFGRLILQDPGAVDPQRLAQTVSAMLTAPGGRHAGGSPAEVDADLGR